MYMSSRVFCFYYKINWCDKQAILNKRWEMLPINPQKSKLQDENI